MEIFDQNAPWGGLIFGWVFCKTIQPKLYNSFLFAGFKLDIAANYGGNIYNYYGAAYYNLKGIVKQAPKV